MSPHVVALPGDPYDGHTLAKVVPDMQALIAIAVTTPLPNIRSGIYTAGQLHRLTPQVKRKFKRRAAIEPVMGHFKDDHRMGRVQIGPA